MWIVALYLLRKYRTVTGIGYGFFLGNVDAPVSKEAAAPDGLSSTRKKTAGLRGRKLRNGGDSAASISGILRACGRLLRRSAIAYLAYLEGNG